MSLQERMTEDEAVITGLFWLWLANIIVMMIIFLIGKRENRDSLPMCLMGAVVIGCTAHPLGIMLPFCWIPFLMEAIEDRFEKPNQTEVTP